MGDHLIVMHSAVRACPGYDRHETPSMFMDGVSVVPDTEHGRAVMAQLTRRHDTLGDAIEAGNFALSAAGVEKGVRRQARAACEDYFYSRLGLKADHVLQPLKSLPPALEPLPEGMQKALEDLIDMVVAGEYEDLREQSHDLLTEDDLRRRLEDDVPEDLILPPSEIYRVEAITKSEDAQDPGWAFFLELWTDEGPARLHIEGEIEESDGRYTTILRDILP